MVPYDVPLSYEQLNAKVQASCVMQAAQIYQIHPYVIQAIIDVEGGKPGTISRNSNNTYDLGVMKINTVNLPRISASFPQVSASDIAHKACPNISVGAWILRQELNRESNFWLAVGNYHSKTPAKRNIYLKKVFAAYRRIVASAMPARSTDLLQIAARDTQP